MGNSVTAAMVMTAVATLVACMSLFLAIVAEKKAKAVEQKASEAMRRVEALEQARES